MICPLFATNSKEGYTLEMDDLSSELSANLLYTVSAGHKSCEKLQLFRPMRPDPLAGKRSASIDR